MKNNKLTRWQTLVVSIGLPVIAMFWAVSTQADPCTPNWGPWQLEPPPPSISDKASSKADQCASVSAVGDYGGPVTASVKVTPLGGVKIRYDANDCENPPYQEDPCNLSSPTTTWTASGCGANPASGSGTTASFNVNAAGSVSVSFTSTATDCFGNSYSASDSTSFTVHLNLPVCTPPEPTPPSDVTLAAPGCTNNGTTTIHYGIAYYVDYTFSGCWGPVTAKESYENPEFFHSDCGHGMSGSVDLPAWKVEGEFGLPIKELFDIGISVEYQGLEFHPDVFTECDSVPYYRWGGNLYKRKTKPSYCYFNGSVTQTDWTYEGDGLWTETGPYTTSVNGKVDFIAAGTDYYVDFVTWTSCKDLCCPNIQPPS